MAVAAALRPVPSPRLAGLAAPLLVELMLGMAVGIVGTVVAARLSDAAGAGFALAHHVFGTLFMLFRIVGAGAGVVLTQALGAGRRDEADRTARALLGASTWLGLAVALPALLVPEALLRLLNTPAEVLPQAAALLAALALVLLLDAWVASGTTVLRSHLRARDTLVVTGLMHLLHLALLGPLMLGLGPLPALGLPGFALAVALARLFAIVLLLLLWRQRLGLVPRAADLWRWRARELRPVAHIGLPAAAENAAYRLALLVSVAATGLLGSAAVATHAYTLQVIMVVLLFGLATGLAVEVVVGHLVGAGRLHEAHAVVRRALAIGLLVSVLVATAAALAGPLLMRGFTQEPAIVAAGVTLLWWTVLLEPGRTFNLVVINALRATGDARYPVQVGAVSMAVVLAGGSWLLGVELGLGLVGIWIAYAADEWLRGLLMWRRWVQLRWVPHARAARRRHRPGGA